MGNNVNGGTKKCEASNDDMEVDGVLSRASLPEDSNAYVPKIP